MLYCFKQRILSYIRPRYGSTTNWEGKIIVIINNIHIKNIYVMGEIIFFGTTNTRWRSRVGVGMNRPASEGQNV